MKDFEIGDIIENKTQGTRAEILEVQELGYWVKDEHGAHWLLQFGWTKNWQIAKEPKKQKENKQGKSKRKQPST
jgi:hypothetical protein